MLNRRTAPEFVINNGWDSLSESLRTFLIGKVSHANYCCDYPSTNLLWVDSNYIDEVCQNIEFWDCLVNDEIMSRKRFRIRTKSDIIDTPNDGMSNDNTMAIFMCNDSNSLYPGAEYLPDSEYQSDFVLTAKYIDNKTYIKDWIRGRGIEGNFDMTKTVGELKEDIKIYYNLIGAEYV